MTKFSFNQAVPFEATHVGEVIKDELSARNMKQSELSELTGIQKSILNDVIKGKRSLTPEMALLLENALGISATYLMNIQTEADKYNVNPQLLFGRYKHDIGIYKIKNFFETKIL